MWCYRVGGLLRDGVEGQDEVEIGSFPPGHAHNSTKAESMTTSFAEKRGGTDLIGKYNQGKEFRVSLDGNWQLPSNTQFTMLPGDVGEDLEMTYPLLG